MARRKPTRAISAAQPAAVVPVGAPSSRGRSVLVTVGTVVATGAIAWFLSTALIGRAVGGRLPAVTNLAADPRLVADAIATADAAARRWPTAATVGELAMTYHASLRPVEAIQTYALAATLDPSNWRWPYYRGLLLEERGDQVGAHEALTAVARLTPQHGLTRFHLAEIAFKAGRREEARTEYLAAQTAGVTGAPAQVNDLPARRGIPLTAYASLGLARLQLEAGNRQAGREQLTAIIRANPDFGSAYALLSRRTDDESAAAADGGRAYVPPADPWLDAVVARSWHPDLLLKHAAIAGRTGEFAWRQWLVQRALTANPNGLDVLLEAAATARAANRPADALAYLRQAEAVAPDDHHTLVEQGRTLSDMGRLAEAEAVLRRAIHVRDATAEYNLANVLDQQDRWDEAREHYERALTINPFHARAMNNLGIGYSRRGQPEKAVPLYRHAIEAAPDLVDSYLNLSAALGVLGQFREALAATDQAIELNPSVANAHNNRGIALAKLGRRDEARAAFEAALRLEPGHTDARRNLALVARPY